MNIMVGYNGSEPSNAAVELAVLRAKAIGAELIIVNCMDEDVVAENIERKEEVLEQVCSQVKGKGVHCEQHLLIRGASAEEDFVNYALERGADEIVIGVRKRSKVGKMVFGSFAQFVILNAHCPVTTVK